MTLLVVLGFGTATLAQEWVTIQEVDLTSATPNADNYSKGTQEFFDGMPENWFANIPGMGSSGELRYNPGSGVNKADNGKYPIYFLSRGDKGDFFCITETLDAGTYRFSYKISNNNGSTGGSSTFGKMDFFWSKGDPASATKNTVASGVSFTNSFEYYSAVFESDGGDFNMGLFPIYVDGFNKQYLISSFKIEKMASVSVDCSVSWNTPENGTIEVLDSEGVPLTNGGTVKSYTTITINSEPAIGYLLTNLEVTGATQIGETNQYNVTGNVTINATFEFLEWEQKDYKEFIGVTTGLEKLTDNGYLTNYTAVSYWGNKEYPANYYYDKTAQDGLFVKCDIKTPGVYKFIYDMYIFGMPNSATSEDFTFFCKKVDDGSQIHSEIINLSKGIVITATTSEFNIETEGTYQFGWTFGKDGGHDVYIRSFELLKKNETLVAPTDCAITWTDPANGSITVKNGDSELTSGSVVESGTELTVTATPDSGYKLSSLTANGVDLIATEGKFTVTEATEISAVFEEIVIVNENRGWNVTVPALTEGNFPAGDYNRIEIDGSILSGNQFTLESWVKLDAIQPEALGKGAIIMGARTDLNGYGYNVAPDVSLFLSNNGLKSWVNSANGEIFGMESGEMSYTSGKFIHLVLTFNNGEAVFYINGVRGASVSTGKTSFTGGNSTFVFGEGINAIFTDIMIWNKVLTEEEIKTSMKGYTSAPSGLLGYYLLDSANASGESESLGTSSVPAKYATVTTDAEGATVDYSGRTFKTELTDVAVDITAERPDPRGGAKFFEGESDVTWLGNGDENFGYFFKTAETKRLAYNGIDKEVLPEEVVAVYHNGDAASPVYVTKDDYTDVNGSVSVTNSYVTGGLSFTTTMPAASVWMPVSLPANVDLVVDNDNDGGAVNLRPMWNFWYSNFKTAYTDGENYSDIWASFEKKEDEELSKSYELVQPGIISVPEARAGHSFTFYTMENEPVVVRALNAEYNATLVECEAGRIAFVANPYSFAVSTSDLVKSESEMDVYRFNAGSGNFDLLSEAATLNPYEPVMVFNTAGGAYKAPRYIGTKAVSGILEYEAVYDVNVRGAEGAVEVSAFQPADVEIYTVNGVMVAAGSVEGTHSFALEAGIYVVRTVVDGNAETVKVVVE